MNGEIKSPITYPENMIFGQPNCGLVGLSIATKKPLDVITEWYRKRAMCRSNWRGRTHSIYYNECLRVHGAWAIHTKYDKARIRTVGDYATWATKPGALYMVRTSGHIMCVRDGYIADQHSILHADFHWCRNKRVKEAWEILG